MAESSNGFGMGVGLILGVLVVVVAIIGAVVFGDGNFLKPKSIDVKTPSISAPSAPATQ
jgi:hypothetical protein